MYWSSPEAVPTFCGTNADLKMATARLFQSGNRNGSSTMEKTISILSTTAALTLFASAVVFAAGAPADTSTLSASPRLQPCRNSPRPLQPSPSPPVVGRDFRYRNALCCQDGRSSGFLRYPERQRRGATGPFERIRQQWPSGFRPSSGGLTTTVGTIGYIAVFDDPGNYKKSAAACLDFTVVPGVPSSDPACQDGQNAAISATYVNSPGFPLPGTYTWNLLLSVHACKNLTDVSAQGGSNAWTGAAMVLLHRAAWARERQPAGITRFRSGVLVR